MKVVVNNEIIRVVFIKEHKKYQYGKYAGKDQLNTICRIFRIVTQDGSIKTEVGSGYANLSHLDQYDKVKGKKIALRRALKKSTWAFLTKEVCEAIWVEFKRVFRSEKQLVSIPAERFAQLLKIEKQFLDERSACKGYEKDETTTEK